MGQGRGGRGLERRERPWGPALPVTFPEPLNPRVKKQRVKLPFMHESNQTKLESGATKAKISENLRSQETKYKGALNSTTPKHSPRPICKDGVFAQPAEAVCRVVGRHTQGLGLVGAGQASVTLRFNFGIETEPPEEEGPQT